MSMFVYAYVGYRIMIGRPSISSLKLTWMHLKVFKVNVYSFE